MKFGIEGETRSLKLGTCFFWNDTLGSIGFGTLVYPE